MTFVKILGEDFHNVFGWDRNFRRLNLCDGLALIRIDPGATIKAENIEPLMRAPMDPYLRKIRRRSAICRRIAGLDAFAKSWGLWARCGPPAAAILELRRRVAFSLLPMSKGGRGASQPCILMVRGTRPPNLRCVLRPTVLPQIAAWPG